MKAKRYVTRIGANGNIELPRIRALKQGTTVEVIVLVPDETGQHDALVDASSSSLGSCDNEVDDRLWNDA